MVLVDSLLTAIVRADGDALVMHVGERPYVVAPAGPVELSSRPLTLDAVSGMLGQLLPLDSRRALEELGAVEHELPPSAVAELERFTVVAARGGDDIWIEVRRHRRPAPAVTDLHELTLEAPPPPPAPVAAERRHAEERVEEPLAERVGRRVETDQEPTTKLPVLAFRGSLASSPATEGTGAPPSRSASPASPEPAVAEADSARAPRPATTAEPTSGPEPAPAVPASEVQPVPQRAHLPASPEPPAPVVAAPRPVVAVEESAAGAPGAAGRSEIASALPPTRAPFVPAPPPASDAAAGAVPPRSVRPPAPAAVEAPPPVIRPIARVAARPEAGPRLQASGRPTAERLVALAAARGAQALFVMSGARPSIRVDGDIAALDGEPALGPAEVEAVMDALAGDEDREAIRARTIDRWEAELPEAGRLRCMRFDDRRGPGCVIGLLPARVPAADQLGISRVIQALAQGTDGLVIVAGSRGSGKSTLVAAMIDQVNRSRGDYIVTLEREVRFAHENRSALVSQRVVHAEESGRAAWSALGEDPDLLVVEDIRSGEALLALVEAAGTGRLAVVSVLAPDAASALGRLVDLVEPDRRAGLRRALSKVVRGIVCQVLLKKNGGGRIAAREFALPSPEVASAIEAGHFDQLSTAMEAGRAAGMVPLADALVAFVQSGAVDVREAWRKAPVRPAFLNALRREGLDTSFVERLA